jgi:hypothetical protein
MDIYIEIMARLEDKVDEQLETCGKLMTFCGHEMRGKVSTQWFR